MTSLSHPEAFMSATPPPSAHLDGFLDRLRNDNPFDVNRVTPAAPDAVDTPVVHAAAFQKLQELAGKVQKQRLALGVMLWGEAGAGKSHQLARLERWANAGNANLVSLANLQAAPEQLPRSLLKAVVSILTQGRVNQFRKTPLAVLIDAAVKQSLRHERGRRYTWVEAEAAYHRLLDEYCLQAPGRAASVDRQMHNVLLRFYRSAHEEHFQGVNDGLAALAVRWLSGDFLEPEDAARLGLPPGPRRDTPVGLGDGEPIKNVLAALSELGLYLKRPLILCFDQIDNLEPQQAGALARFLHALLDSAVNLLVVTSGLRQSLTDWLSAGVIQESTWHRLAQHEIQVQRITPGEAIKIVQDRLQPVQTPFMSLPPLRNLIQRDLLFPLGQSWADEFLEGKIEVRPRDVINWAREGWRREQEALNRLGGARWLETWGRRAPVGPARPLTPAESDALTVRLIQQRLSGLIKDKIDHPEKLPPDGDNLAGLLSTLLERYGSVDRLKPLKNGARPAYDLILYQRQGNAPEIRTGIVCVTADNAISVTGYLRRLHEDDRPLQRVFLISDERRPLSLGTAGREYLDNLRLRYGSSLYQVELTVAQYAELDALQAVVGLARAGDLEVELPGGQARRVTEAEVLASVHRQERFQVHPLLKQLLAFETK
jgi:hypothetical protein